MIKNIQIQKFIFHNTNKIFEFVSKIKLKKMINKKVVNKKSNSMKQIDYFFTVTIYPL